MKTRKQILHDIGEAVREEIGRNIKNSVPFDEKYISSRNNVREAIEALAKYEHQQAKIDES